MGGGERKVARSRARKKWQRKGAREGLSDRSRFVGIAAPGTVLQQLNCPVLRCMCVYVYAWFMCKLLYGTSGGSIEGREPYGAGCGCLKANGEATQPCELHQLLEGVSLLAGLGPTPPQQVEHVRYLLFRGPHVGAQLSERRFHRCEQPPLELLWF